MTGAQAEEDDEDNNRNMKVEEEKKDFFNGKSGLGSNGQMSTKSCAGRSKMRQMEGPEATMKPSDGPKSPIKGLDQGGATTNY